MSNALRTLARGTVLAALLASCSTERIYTQNRETLQAVMGGMERGELAAAETSATSVLVMTGETPDLYRVQRFFATYLLAQLHMQAFFQGPFLVPRGGDRAGSGFDAFGNVKAPEPSRLGHLVAANYHVGYGLDWYGGVRGANLTEDGESLLPPPLEELGIQNALISLNLSSLAVYSRLRFQDSVARMLEGMRELTDLESCTEVLDQARVSEHVRPWVYLAVFDNLRAEDPRKAYRFAISALHTPGSRDALPESDRRVVSTWITEGAPYTFMCTECKIEVDPEFETCLGGCPRRSIDFVPMTDAELKLLQE